MHLKPIDINSFQSDIECKYYIDDDDRVLMVSVYGNYRPGSKGSIDANKIYSGLAAYYFLIEPQVILIDLSELTYQWGNTLVKVLDFLEFIGRNDYEKGLPVAFVISNKNAEAIATLLGCRKENLPSNYYYDSTVALAALVEMLDN